MTSGVWRNRAHGNVLLLAGRRFARFSTPQLAQEVLDPSAVIGEGLGRLA
jgi:hypothetical protein